MALEGKVKIPLMGEVSRKSAAIGATIFAAFIGVMYVRHARNAAATNASPAGGTAAGAAGSTDLVTDPAGNQCAAVDPGSGYCPGSSQDAAYQAEQGQYYGGLGAGYGSSTDQYGGLVSNSPYVTGAACTAADGSPGVTDSLGNCIPTGTGTGGGTLPVVSSNPTTADGWIIQTAGELPGDAATFTTAAAMVFAGLTVTTAQKNLFLEGVGINPLPPGITYPQPIKTSDTSGQPGGGNAGTPGQATVPGVTGERATPAEIKVKAAGFKVMTEPSRNPAKIYTVTGQSPGGGTKAAKGSMVTLNVREG
jgi:hypothetical protein